MLIRLSVISLLLNALASCTSFDAGYAELDSKADSHPSRDAIVGLWNRNHPGSLMIDPHSITELYRADGTGLWSYRAGRNPLGALMPDNPKQLTWKVAPDGTWHVSYGGGQSAVCKISHGKLLQKRVIIGGVVHWVLAPAAQN